MRASGGFGSPIKASIVPVIGLLFIDTLAHADWPSQGVYLDTVTHDHPHEQLATDGESGTLVVWTRWRDGWGNIDLFAQRVSASGAVMWTTGGVPICTAFREKYAPLIVADDSGGAIIAWNDGRDSPDCCSSSHVYLQRVDRHGSPVWALDGIRLVDSSDGDRLVGLVANGVGGAIVLWSERRANTSYIFAQRIDANGINQWNPDGEVVCEGCYPDYPVAEPDGAGGVIVAWNDSRVQQYELFVQRLNASGAALWAPNGTPASASASWKLAPRIACDGAGGTFAVWTDFGNSDLLVYAQRIDASGNVAWGADGMRVSSTDDSQSGPTVVQDGLGGAIVVWQEAPQGGWKVRAQRFDAFGSGRWPGGGINICDMPTDQGRASAHSDENGGAVVTWLDSRTPWVLVSQRVNSDGERLWAGEGIVLGPGVIPGSYGPTVISNGIGGTIVAREVGTKAQSSLFVHGIDADGDAPTAIAPLTPPSLVVSESFPNPFASATRVDIVLGRAVLVLADVFDVAGRRVRAMPAQQFASGAQSIVFDGRDDAGRTLPSGVYFLRIEVNGEKITRKMVIAR